ncbi:MAG: toll/interleukin-1 receptor domain-containing protein [Synergistaceae bacterium]|nr:toll/interleukin-1 receptor domain-containing protein [Synergistaceae bacterium]
MNNPKLFLSYPASEIKLVQHVSDYMNNYGLDTWFAAQNLPGLEFWPKEIVESIKNCDAFVIFFNKKADDSTYIQNEVSIAVENKKPIFCLRLENVEPDNLKIFLNTKQWHDWFNKKDDSILETLTQGIIKILTKSAHYEPKRKLKISKKIFVVSTIILLTALMIFRLLTNDVVIEEKSFFPLNLKEKVTVIAKTPDTVYSDHAENIITELMTQKGYNIIDKINAKKINNNYDRKKIFRKILGNFLSSFLNFDVKNHGISEIIISFNISEPRENEFQFFSATASVTLSIVTPDGEIFSAKTMESNGLSYSGDSAQLKALDNAINSATSELFKDLKE